MMYVLYVYVMMASVRPSARMCGCVNTCVCMSVCVCACACMCAFMFHVWVCMSMCVCCVHVYVLLMYSTYVHTPCSVCCMNICVYVHASLTMPLYAVVCGGEARLAELVCWMCGYMAGLRV